MLAPAMLYQDEIYKGFARYIYDDEITYYSGWNGFTIPEISEEFDGMTYRYAILDNERVIGYFCYTYDIHSKCLRNLGLYSFDKGNFIIGKDVLYKKNKLLKNINHIEWSGVWSVVILSKNIMITFVKDIMGKKIVLTDAICDKAGVYHNDLIYEIIFTNKENNI